MELKREKKYEFRKRMRTVHKGNIRDYDAVITNEDLEIKDGTKIVLPDFYDEVMLTAARDFEDYMFVSMDVFVSVCYGETNGDCIGITIDENMGDDYVIKAGDCVEITARTSRAAAQALYRLEDIMNERKAPYIKKDKICHKNMFSPRMVHSGYALDSYPNEHLSAIAHAGMDAIVVFVSGVNRTPSGFLDFNDLIDRAAKYGIDVYAYSYLISEMHPEDEGAQEFYDNLYGKIFKECPGFKGVILVGESVSFPSHDPHTTYTKATAHGISARKDGIPATGVNPGWWPCYDYPEWLECVKKSVRAHREDADIVFWTYNWGYAPAEDRLRLIRTLPKDISLLVTYEMFESYPNEDYTQTVADYSLAFAGPGKYFLSEAEEAKKCGIRLYAMSNTGGLSWDFGTVPYEPMPYQWIRRYEGLRDAYEKYGLCGLMESHHYGFFPSFVSDLAKKCFSAYNTSYTTSLAEVITKHFGSADLEKTDKALELWSEAIRHYTPTAYDQYGAFRCGPSYPLCLIKAIKPPSEDFAHFGNSIMGVVYPTGYSPNDSASYSSKMFPSLTTKGEIASLEKMLSFMKQGIDILKEIETPNEELLYLINLGEYIRCTIITGIHAKKWFVLKTALMLEHDHGKACALLEDIKKILAQEEQNAREAITFTDKDSRLGWEPSMDYIGDSERIEWKLRHIDYVLKREIPFYERGLSENWISNK